jgi:hypothetical protein
LGFLKPFHVKRNRLFEKAITVLAKRDDNRAAIAVA